MSATLRSYRDLVVWQKAVELAVSCHQAAKRLPKQEMYGLSLQIRRSSVSVSANIAEGHGREHLGDYLHHLSIANGSLMELESTFSFLRGWRIWIRMRLKRFWFERVKSAEC